MLGYFSLYTHTYAHELMPNSSISSPIDTDLNYRFCVAPMMIGTLYKNPLKIINPLKIVSPIDTI